MKSTENALTPDGAVLQQSDSPAAGRATQPFAGSAHGEQLSRARDSKFRDSQPINTPPPTRFLLYISTLVLCAAPPGSRTGPLAPTPPHSPGQGLGITCTNRERPWALRMGEKGEHTGILFSQGHFMSQQQK